MSGVFAHLGILLLLAALVSVVLALWRLAGRGVLGAFEVGRREHEAGRYAEAERHLLRALQAAENLPPHDATRLAVMDLLGRVYLAEGKLDEAQSLLEESLTRLRECRAPDDPDMAAGLNNLGMLYKARGQHAEAEAYYRQALDIWEGANEPEDEQVAVALNNLGNPRRRRPAGGHWPCGRRPCRPTTRRW